MDLKLLKKASSFFSENWEAQGLRSQQSCLLWFQDSLGPPLGLPLHYPGQGLSTCAEKKV